MPSVTSNLNITTKRSLSHIPPLDSIRAGGVDGYLSFRFFESLIPQPKKPLQPWVSAKESGG